MIIGITGTLGAGKGTVADYLVAKHGFKHYSARDVWNEEIVKRGLPINRDNMVLIANDLRAKHGPDYFARTAIEKAKAAGVDAVIESIRAVGEAQTIQQNGGLVWAVDADVKTRYERIVVRQSESDKVTFDKFVQDEKTEWENTDPNKQNIKAVIGMADKVFNNDGTEEDLFAQVEEALKNS
ncbi:AAA family ATPase [Candidatus Parcubacteria bacterium]|nr:AAA family ATPase [Candidatus Parcubacteria bacterium]